MEKIESQPCSELYNIKAAAGPDFLSLCDSVKAGKAEFFKISECYFLTFAQGSELVVACAQGKNVIKASKLIYSQAKKAGYKTIRLHVTDDRVAQLIKRGFAFKQCETVYRLEL